MLIIGYIYTVQTSHSYISKKSIKLLCCVNVCSAMDIVQLASFYFLCVQPKQMNMTNRMWSHGDDELLWGSYLGTQSWAA